MNRWNFPEDNPGWDRDPAASPDSGYGGSDTTTFEEDRPLEALGLDGPPSIWLEILRTTERMREAESRRVQRTAIVAGHMARMLHNGLFQRRRDGDPACK